MACKGKGKGSKSKMSKEDKMAINEMNMAFGTAKKAPKKKK